MLVGLLDILLSTAGPTPFRSAQCQRTSPRHSLSPTDGSVTVPLAESRVNVGSRVHLRGSTALCARGVGGAESLQLPCMERTPAGLSRMELVKQIFVKKNLGEAWEQDQGLGHAGWMSLHRCTLRPLLLWGLDPVAIPPRVQRRPRATLRLLGHMKDPIGKAGRVRAQSSPLRGLERSRVRIYTEMWVVS